MHFFVDKYATILARKLLPSKFHVKHSETMHRKLRVIAIAASCWVTFCIHNLYLSLMETLYSSHKRLFAAKIAHTCAKYVMNKKCKLNWKWEYRLRKTKLVWTNRIFSKSPVGWDRDDLWNTFANTLNFLSMKTRKMSFSFEIAFFLQH